MILVFMLLVGVGGSVCFWKNSFEVAIPYVLISTFASMVFIPTYISTYGVGVQYDNYTDSFNLMLMEDGRYCSMSDDKVTVIISNDTIQKPKTFPNKVVSFVNDNTANIHIQGKRVSNSKMLKMLFFCEIKEKDIVENVVISFPRIIQNNH